MALSDRVQAVLNILLHDPELAKAFWMPIDMAITKAQEDTEDQDQTFQFSDTDRAELLEAYAQEIRGMNPLHTH
jgi:hypothetical protein